MKKQTMDKSEHKSELDEDSNELDDQIQSIIERCNKIPEVYREKCFEILLKNILNMPEFFDTKKPAQTSEKKQEGGGQDISFPIDVRAFLTQYQIDESLLKKLFLIDGQEEIRTTYKIDDSVVSKAQIQIALLTSLENSIKDSDIKFEFSSNDVRKRCQGNNVYDSKNYARHFKKNSNLFKSLADLEHICLSPEGKSELAEVISEVTNG